MTSNHNTPKYTYYRKSGHIYSSLFIRKNHKTNIKWALTFFSCLLKKRYETNMQFTPRNNMYFTNVRGPNKILIQKVKT